MSWYRFHYTIGSVVVFFIQYFSGKFQPLLCNGCSFFKTASEITRRNVEARAGTRPINNLVDRRFNYDNIGYYLDIHRKWNGFYIPPTLLWKKSTLFASVGRSGAQVLSPSLLKVAKHCLLIDGRFLCPVVKCQGQTVDFCSHDVRSISNLSDISDWLIVLGFNISA